MKKGVLLLLVTMNISCINKAVFTQKELYPTDEIKATHNRIAILRVNYVFNKDSEMIIEKLVSNNDPSKAITKQEDSGYRVQQIIYEELANYYKNLNWISPEKTNELLKERQIDYHALRHLSKADIAKELNVEAIIYCDIFISKAAALKIGMVNGIPAPVTGKVPEVEFTVEIYSSIENDLLWKAKSIFRRDRFYVESSFRKIIKSDLAPILPFD